MCFIYYAVFPFQICCRANFAKFNSKYVPPSIVNRSIRKPQLRLFCSYLWDWINTINLDFLSLRQRFKHNSKYTIYIYNLDLTYFVFCPMQSFKLFISNAVTNAVIVTNVMIGAPDRVHYIRKLCADRNGSTRVT